MRAWLGRSHWLRELRARWTELRGLIHHSQVRGPLHPLDEFFDPALPEHYVSVGKEASRLVTEAWSTYGDGPGPPSHVLDFGCGYGRVLRHLCEAFPEAEITAADIDSPAVRFCRDHLGAHGCVVSAELEARFLPGPFDVVWAGSLFSHLAPSRWHSALAALRERLSPVGVLVLTTHGPSCLDHPGLYRAVLPSAEAASRALESEGILFAPYPGRSDYGITFVDPKYLGDAVCERRARGWDHHQDVYVLGAG